jgi:hypothetical protein
MPAFDFFLIRSIDRARLKHYERTGRNEVNKYEYTIKKADVYSEAFGDSIHHSSIGSGSGGSVVSG